MVDEKPMPSRPVVPPPELGRAIPEVDVKSIVAGGREAVILHEGERYRLRITANDKLILTK